jgi:hypothetical protein
VKIIAKISDNKVLVEMTHRELANVVGKDYENELVVRGNYTRTGGTEVGTEYKISDAWFRLRSQASAAMDLEGVSKTLSALSDLVLQTKVAYTNATKEEDGGTK